MRFSINIVRCVLLFSLVSISSNGLSWQVLTNNIDLECIQSEKSVLHCSYRLLIPEPALAINAETAGTFLNITDERTYPWPGSRTSILFVIDTSDPGRQNVVENNKRHIQTLLDLRESHFDFGLVSFDKDLRVDAPLGSSDASILSALESITAVGRTTEMYRNLIQAIQLLQNSQSDRKVIYLFSDGQAEDKAYFHSDVIDEARKAGVIINGLGFPRSVSLSVALQTVRRLSDETGGRYYESDTNYNLPGAFLMAPYDNIETGGTFTVALQNVPPSNSEQSQIRITLDTNIGDIIANVPILTPNKLATAASTISVQPRQAAPTPAPAPVTEIRYVNQPAAEEQRNLWIWYGIPIGLAILIIISVITMVIIFLRNESKTSVQASAATNYKPYAYLVVQDETGTRYPITNTTWRIGRTKDNELTLNDNSVSRRHAEIHRYSNGNFIIFDVDSLNGIYVNDEKIKKKRLEEGDILEIGDIFLRFTLYSTDYQNEDDTALQQTRTPPH